MYYAFEKELAIIGNRRNPDGPINPRQKKKEKEAISLYRTCFRLLPFINIKYNNIMYTIIFIVLYFQIII